MLALLVHRLHYGTDDPGKDRTTARAAKRIGDETTQCPGGSRVGSSSTPKEATKQRPMNWTDVLENATAHVRKNPGGKAGALRLVN